MSTTDRDTILASLRGAPARSLLLSAVPFALAAGQLANGYVNDLPLPVAVCFAAAMVAFSVAAMRHDAAQRRLARLEATIGDGTS